MHLCSWVTKQVLGDEVTLLLGPTAIMIQISCLCIPSFMSSCVRHFKRYITVRGSNVQYCVEDYKHPEELDEATCAAGNLLQSV